MMGISDLAFINAEHSAEWPEGYDIMVGERSIRLSGGGHRPRIDVARALYRDPTVLWLGEATSALGNNTEATVVDGSHELVGTRTIILGNAHPLTTLWAWEVVLRLQRGRVEAETASTLSAAFMATRSRCG